MVRDTTPVLRTGASLASEIVTSADSHKDVPLFTIDEVIPTSWSVHPLMAACVVYETDQTPPDETATVALE